ncbi:hypothetical protein A2482_00460 [Candidatus Falkowbacteria bacterium RIFOXYC2_FULL_48_21]|uniref:Uncharacterized protein n=1 Tax=Candidatus Falkowbacteria bacterium RIFOXYC2_FULL_48_21 TaxID=1798005 RepID=A0A1F5TFN0_9BACT|nr:MAG: hypothetical protein A2482_00460 [Candidatus Falkowbacteria bacterium RIFOXYC2_FULL_48_21]
MLDHNQVTFKQLFGTKSRPNYFLADVTDNGEFWRTIIDSFFRNVGLEPRVEKHLRSLISQESRPEKRRNGPYGVYGGPGDDGGALIRGADFDWGRHLADSLPRYN